MKYAIYPPIGFARIGNSDEFFFSPEKPDSTGTEIDRNGIEIPVESFKDSNLKQKKQAARFQVFQISESGTHEPISIPDSAFIKWSVTVVNKKDAVKRPPAPPDFPRKVEVDQNRVNRVITAQGSISGPSSNIIDLKGQYLNKEVLLGNVRTDGIQRLTFLGGNGISETLSNPPAQIGNDFYNNPDWYDDVCDGLIEAEIVLSETETIEAEPAWVVVGPPDFSPISNGIVTLYDLIFQVAIDEQWVDEIERPYFNTHIKPIIERAISLKWVSGNSLWSKISTDFVSLRNPDSSNQTLRNETYNYIIQAEDALNNFYITDWQLDVLELWKDGKFNSGDAPNRGLCDVLTRSVLDNTLGQGLYPGIEAGINMTDKSIYLNNPFEFRLNQNKISPGDVTALMALPWQADFLKCSSGWWPAQRPNIAPQEAGADRPWLRPTMNHASLVKNVMKLGVISKNKDNLIIEQGRHPDLGR